MEATVVVMGEAMVGATGVVTADLMAVLHPPLLAQALATTQDAINGYWNAKPGNIGNPQIPTDLDSLRYLSERRRIEVLLGTLTSRMQVVPDTSVGNKKRAEVRLDGKPICAIRAPNLSAFKKQMVWVRNYSDLRTDRTPEITLQTTDIMSFFGAASLLNYSHRRRTVELLMLVQSLSIHLEMQVKHYCWSPRPIDFAHQVQPIIQTPDHSTFPSGHATEAFALATVLHRLETGRSAQDGISGPAHKGQPAMAFRIAHRIAVNRTIAGVHFPVDSAAGAFLGCMIGEAIHSIATLGKTTRIDYGAGTKLPAKDDFTQGWLRSKFSPTTDGTCVDDTSPLFRTFWDSAKKEWQAGGA